MPTMTITLYIGALLLLLLSIQDFHRKVSKRRKVVQYYTCMSLFVAFNLIIYMLICTILSDVNYFALLIGQVTEDLPPEKKLLPILLAFAYFGIGSVDIPLVGGKVVSIYGSLLKIFQSMYKSEEIDIDPIATKIKQLKAQSNQLREAIENFNDTGRRHGYDILADKWQNLTEDLEALEAHIESLIRVRVELCDGKPVNILKINSLLGNQLDKITEKTNKKLKDHIEALVEANAENASALRGLLPAIGVELSFSVPVSSSVHLSRAIVFSFFGGALLGSVLPHLQPNLPESYLKPHRIWSWMLALGIFGTIFSFIARVPKDSPQWALALGAIAGAAGHSVLVLVNITFGKLTHPLPSLPELLQNIIYGLYFGACMGLITHVFHYVVRPKVRSHVLCYLLIAIAGATIFITLSAVVFPTPHDIDWTNRIMYFLVSGAFIAIVAAFITNIFYEPYDFANSVKR